MEKNYECQISKEILTFTLHKVHILKLFFRYSEGNTVGKHHLLPQIDYKSDMLTFTYPIPICSDDHIHSSYS